MGEIWQKWRSMGDNVMAIEYVGSQGFNTEIYQTRFADHIDGFILAGGQIINSPKNLPCPVCECDM
jgi:hypothetical protein